ncbi:MAG TPA: FlgD immunoglobulin-like domain containing protein [Candidatus Krumholzibacteria bacterium]
MSANRLESFPGVAALNVELPHTSNVEMEVLNRRGKRLWAMQLLHERAGAHTILFDGRDHRGRPLRTGTYFYRITANGSSVTRKVTVSAEPLFARLLRMDRRIRQARSTLRQCLSGLGRVKHASF